MFEAFRFREHVEPHVAELDGMSVRARDGEIGSVDAVIPTTAGSIVLVSTGLLGFGKSHELPAGLVMDVDLEERAIRVDATSQAIKDAPQHGSGVAHGSALEAELLEHYGESADAVPSAGAGLPSASDQPVRTPVAPPVQADPPAMPTAATPPSPVREFGETSLAGDAPADAVDRETGAPSTSAFAPTGFEERQEKQPEYAETSLAGDAAVPSPPPDASDDEEGTAATAAARPLEPALQAEPPSAAPPAAAEEDAGAHDAAAPGAPGYEAPEDAAATPAAHPLDAALEAETRAEAPRASEEQAATPKKDGGDAGTSGKRKATRARGSVPIPGYDDLSASDIAARLRGLSQSDLSKVERYERGHADRKTVLERIESLRGDQPWRGYDGQNVADVKKRLAKAEPETARTVRDYERRHKERAGVLQAAQRRLEDG